MQGFDAVICMGSSHALGSPREALKGIRSLLNPTGVTVIGEVVWAASPPEPYLSFLGISEEFYWAQGEGLAVLRAGGLEPVSEVVASSHNWEAYERCVLEGRLSVVESLPPDEAKLTTERANTWFEMFERYGRHVMGFAGYVAQRQE